MKLEAQPSRAGQTSPPTCVLGDAPVLRVTAPSPCFLSGRIFLTFAKRDRTGSQNAERAFPSWRFLTYFVLLGWRLALFKWRPLKPSDVFTP